ncbi:polymer-forming cytoskeletal protein [Petroclostridium sp. X23]|uniref:bactofilin family protein n=1 Tax=Petroclostridium sp. X23 TaxID=3045146 RepID=UPI0024AE4A9C|nr:polymer-forming cytoskeletal protein [Petroclostridium sp. X23]WHH58904.1 polymer-forming cytoskeletal protein [Petroclostridium sp. X23]
MFSKKSSDSLPVDTFIGEKSTFEGNIKLQGTVSIDGKVLGEITAEGDVIIGEKANITGNIYANNIIISGSVKGNITATGQLRLTTTAKLMGDIKIGSLITDDGAVFQGNCGMLDKNSATTNLLTQNTLSKPKEKETDK